MLYTRTGWNGFDPIPNSSRITLKKSCTGIRGRAVAQLLHVLTYVYHSLVETTHHFSTSGLRVELYFLPNVLFEVSENLLEFNPNPTWIFPQ